MKPSTLGERIVYFRKKIGMSQKKLAVSAGLKCPALSCYEKDKREPSVAIIKKISKVLNVTGDTLLGLEPKPDLIAQNRDEYTVLHLFRGLNDLGRKRALDNMHDLSEILKYSNSAK